jgi:hypothetical protein
MGGTRRSSGSGKAAHAGGRARGGRGIFLVVGLLLAVLVAMAAFAVRPGRSAEADTQTYDLSTTAPVPTTDAPTRTATATPSATGTPSVPQHGTGSFTTADASAKPAGSGRIRRYEVQVEGGADISAADAAREIQGILADPRGWTDDGRDGFQLVSSGPADFVIKIATPDTVDAICGAAGLHTHGEVNCDVGPTVVVNLKRWLLGSPEFPGPIQDYRALIINHEVGHRIGHGHEGCPGPGRLAPVMMQQIDGLHGCKANAWPYDAQGRYIQGPPVA